MIFQDQSGLGQGIETGLGVLGQALGKRVEESRLHSRQKEQGNILSQMFSQLGPDPSPIALTQALASSMSQGVQPDVAQKMGSLFAALKQKRGLPGTAGSPGTVGSPIDLQAAFSDKDMRTSEGRISALQSLLSMGVSFSDSARAMKEATPSEYQQFINREMKDFQQPQIQGPPEDFQQPPMQQPDVHPAHRGMADNNISDEELMRASASLDPQLVRYAQARLQERDRAHSRFTEDRKYHTAGAKKHMEKIDEIRISARGRRSSMQDMRRAIKENNLGFLSRSWWANLFGKYGKGLLTSEGAILQTAAKNFMLEDLSRISGRPNMFIEQRILSMLPEIGKSKWANLSIAAVMDQQLSLDEERVRLTDSLAQEDEEKYGYVRSDISRRVDSQLQPYAEDIQRKLSFNLRLLQEEQGGDKWVRKNIKTLPSTGTVATGRTMKAFIRKYDGDAVKAIQNMQKMGYYVPTKTEVDRWQR